MPLISMRIANHQNIGEYSRNSDMDFVLPLRFLCLCGNEFYAGRMDCGRMNPATWGVKRMLFLCTTGCAYCSNGIT
jgi:hypothetical protein